MDDETIGEGTTPETAAEAAPEAATTAPPPPAPAATGSPAPRRRWPGWAAVILTVVAVGTGAFFLGRWVGSDEPAGSPAAAATTTTMALTWTADTLTPGEEPVADVAAALSPSVVQIETDTGLGSGVIYRSDGYIITAAHVVRGAERLTVRLADGTRLDGEVVGADGNSDVAVIKVEETGLPAAPIADSDEVQTGQMAIAIGSPWGLDGSVSSGVISSVRRTITGSDGIPRTMIQTDTPINPGNSGGALADRRGRVVGINDAIYSASGGSDGVGFAIPINTAVSVADRLIAGEEIRTAFLGVTGTDTTSGAVGALISGVTGGSPADEADLRVGDLITRYDGQTIESFTDLGAAVRDSRPGDRVTLTVQRGDQEITVEATLGERPDE
ncbi:MAG TPA: trypsin-like peptidase domain-containing protein [Acidimicrobiia bacterium]|nr:trypsin-like peptidase domain-containing protein [Acidimicrobiia bacterium]